jgi:hypothetical protein
MLPLVFSVFWLHVAARGADSPGPREVILSEAETPAEAVVYYIDDKKNTGIVAGGPRGAVVSIDEIPIASIAVGSVGGSDIEVRMRKFFLMFRLPPKADRKLSQAVLRLRLGHVTKGNPENPLPPVALYHAGEWLDEKWETDPEFHGLGTIHFGSTDLFPEKVDVCDAATKPGFVTVDVTKMIRADYERASEPVAVFRLEVPDPGRVLDKALNSYSFFGPGQAPDKAPALQLSFE